MTLKLNWPDGGLIPVVIQDEESDEVLMVAFMNAEALEATRSSGEVHFWSRSRNELWHKGGSSGHVQRVRSISTNCDLNSLLIRVEQVGATCHDGFASCFYRDIQDDDTLELNQDRLFDPRDVYGDGYGLQALTHEWWGAYEWLADNNLTAESGTSRLLRDPDASVLHRIQDELKELAGVLDGSHFHSNQHDDALLEGSQCCYWIVVAAIRSDLQWDDVRPDRAMDVLEASVESNTAASVLRAEATALTTFSAGVASHLLAMIAEGVRTLDIEPRALIERDIAELRTRPYLSEYFAR